MAEPVSPPFSRGNFPVPNVLIDEWMPNLKDTEMRLLLVVLRQTVGRQEVKTGLPKERDWLSQSQLKKRTGRGGDAVATAIDALVKQGLLSVETEDGKLLPTPQARRRHLAKLFYRVGTAIMKKSKTEKEKGIGEKAGLCVGKAGEKLDIYGVARDIFCADTSQSRVDKADTTTNKQYESKKESSIDIVGNRAGTAEMVGVEMGGKKSVEEVLAQAQRDSIEEIKKSIREQLRTIVPVTSRFHGRPLEGHQPGTQS